MDIGTGRHRHWSKREKGRKIEAFRECVSLCHTQTHTHARKATDFERVPGVDVYLER